MFVVKILTSGVILIVIVVCLSLLMYLCVYCHRVSRDGCGLMSVWFTTDRPPSSGVCAISPMSLHLLRVVEYWEDYNVICLLGFRMWLCFSPTSGPG